MATVIHVNMNEIHENVQKRMNAEQSRSILPSYGNRHPSVIIGTKVIHDDPVEKPNADIEGDDTEEATVTLAETSEASDKIAYDPADPADNGWTDEQEIRRKRNLEILREGGNPFSTDNLDDGFSKSKVSIVESDTDDFYENIRYNIDNGVFVMPQIAAHLITAEIKHRTVMDILKADADFKQAIRAENPEYEGEDKDITDIDVECMDKELFDFIEQLICYHINTYMRYTSTRSSIRKYCSIKKPIAEMIGYANERYVLDINADTVLTEIDKMYEVIK